MRFSKRLVTVVFVLSLFFYAVQGFIWVRAIAHTHSETDKQNIEQSHPPTFIPSIIATGFLAIAVALASMPTKSRSRMRV
jgi:hypothetical protein